MTLLTTEFHRTHSGYVIVFAADRCIARGTERAADREKVLGIPGHRAGIGYFGLAEVAYGRGMQPLDEWLRDRFYRLGPDDTLEDIAVRLAAELNRVVPRDVRLEEPSGLHLAGFNSGRPEFWFVRNVDDERRPTLGEYLPREDFQRRDLQDFPNDGYWIYRNGDLRAHERVWVALDEALAPLLGTEGFRPLETPDDYCSWVKLKMEVIASFYEALYETPIIGHPIDAFAIDGVL